MDTALKAMLHDTVQIAPWIGTDSYGKPTYGPAVTYAARIEHRFQTVPSTTGAQLHDLTTVFLPEDAVVDTRSQVTIAGRIVSLQGVKKVQDELGNLDHIQLFL